MNTGKERILVVDDNTISRIALSETLRVNGFDVDECDCGTGCREYLRRHHPDLILLDVNLPDANGMDLCREFKADERLSAVFIGLISASQITPDDQADGLNLGADAYITRPVPAYELIARVKALLRIQKAEQALRDANEELEHKVAARTADLAAANHALQEEIQERRIAENAQKRLALRLGALHALDQAILQSTSTRQISEASLDCLHELSPAESLQVWRLDSETKRIECLAHRGAPKITIESRPIDEKLRTIFEHLAQAPRLEIPNETHPFVTGSERIWETLHLFPLKAREALLGAIVVARDHVAEDDELAAGGEEIAGTLSIALSQSQLFDEVTIGRSRMRELSRRMLQVQEEERRYLSRELHDEIGQNLTGIKSLLESGIRETEATEKLNKALAIVNELMSQVRRLSIDLRPQMLDDLGLTKALSWQFGRLREQAGLEVDFQHNDPEARLPADFEIALFRIAQEALTNVIRHSGSLKATVRLWIETDRCRLQIHDTGNGFDARSRLGEFRTAGLTGMIERAELLGGELLIESGDGNGTCLTVDLPLT
jgi:signal transduction histidine kinase